MKTNSLDQVLLEKAVQFIHDNIADPDLSADDLASALSMSQRNAYRKIKALTNQPINDFIKILRLKMAIKLLGEKKINYFRNNFSCWIYIAFPFYKVFQGPVR